MTQRQGQGLSDPGIQIASRPDGLTARVEEAHDITVLHDDRPGMRRISPVVRVTEWDGELALGEPEKFVRWTWHPLRILATLGTIFMPSVPSLNTVFPGVLPGAAAGALLPVPLRRPARAGPTVAGQSS
ncbi:hypothetical protein [Streptomyces sp. NPDC088131]|uniref:hypothetical protein n=1 Tax=Streptomyces sp. NPDC088131 TaxID=3365826 RepID=UPI00381879FF